MFPVASQARIVTVLEPINRGIEAVQCEVPLTAPDLPVLVDQLTAVTPTLSLAVPLMLIDADEVETEDADGEVRVMDGGVVSPEVGFVGA